MNQQPTCTDAELREQYDLAKLAMIGIDFARAMRTSYIRIGLENAVLSRRRLAAKQARAAALPHQIKEAA